MVFSLVKIMNYHPLIRLTERKRTQIWLFITLEFNPTILHAINVWGNKSFWRLANQGQVPHHNKEIVSFVVLLTRGVLVLLLVRRVVIAREKTILLRVPKGIGRSGWENSACNGWRARRQRRWSWSVYIFSGIKQRMAPSGWLARHA